MTKFFTILLLAAMSASGQITWPTNFADMDNFSTSLSNAIAQQVTTEMQGRLAATNNEILTRFPVDYTSLLNKPTVTSGTNGAAGAQGVQGIQGIQGISGVVGFTAATNGAAIAYSQLPFSPMLTNANGVNITNIPVGSIVGTPALAALASFVSGTLTNSITGNASTATTLSTSPTLTNVLIWGSSARSNNFEFSTAGLTMTNIVGITNQIFNSSTGMVFTASGTNGSGSFRLSTNGAIYTTGIISAVNGFAVTATNTYALAATGWTNVLGCNARVFITVSTTAALSSTNGTAIVTIGAVTTFTEFTMHPNERLVGTGITGKATP